MVNIVLCYIYFAMHTHTKDYISITSCEKPLLIIPCTVSHSTLPHPPENLVHIPTREYLLHWIIITNLIFLFCAQEIWALIGEAIFICLCITTCECTTHFYLMYNSHYENSLLSPDLCILLPQPTALYFPFKMPLRIAVFFLCSCPIGVVLVNYLTSLYLIFLICKKRHNNGTYLPVLIKNKCA